MTCDGGTYDLRLFDIIPKIDMLNRFGSGHRFGLNEYLIRRVERMLAMDVVDPEKIKRDVL